MYMNVGVCTALCNTEVVDSDETDLGEGESAAIESTMKLKGMVNEVDFVSVKEITTYAMLIACQWRSSVATNLCVCVCVCVCVCFREFKLSKHWAFRCFVSTTEV